ncbi:MAG: hypothetical protein RKO66_00590 [Candidatus Contendobacter sp.]|nr:hypothetical protein [Candidatus Contendobacter sp.]MDS4058852.1 hypothetical protein [Candidatus Contendobacter sp.]
MIFRWRWIEHPATSTAALSDPSAIQPQFTLDASGNDRIELVVNDSHEGSAPNTVIVSTINRPPVAKAGPERAAVVG